MHRRCVRLPLPVCAAARRPGLYIAPRPADVQREERRGNWLRRLVTVRADACWCAYRAGGADRPLTRAGSKQRMLADAGRSGDASGEVGGVREGRVEGERWLKGGCRVDSAGGILENARRRR